MDIFITLDYEIYFGRNPGTIAKCIIEPTNMLAEIAKKHGVRFSFFVDCGFLLKLDEFRNIYPVLQNDYAAIVSQIKKLAESGHDLQLHIHPHWEDSYFDGAKWVVNTTRYKLSDFASDDIEDIVYRYKSAISEITGKTVFVNRAGGWCIQPFQKLKTALMNHGINADSTVFRNGKNKVAPYDYDFTNAPDKTSWSFEEDPVKEKQDGYFTEIAISSIKVSPLFYWKLFLVGRLNPYMHKPLGDGRHVISKGYRRKILTSFTQQSASFDGDNVKLLDKTLQVMMKKGNELVVLGHPKAVSRYSLKKLEDFIRCHKTNHNFTTFSEFFRK